MLTECKSVIAHSHVQQQSCVLYSYYLLHVNTGVVLNCDLGVGVQSALHITFLENFLVPRNAPVNHFIVSVINVLTSPS